MSDVVDPTLFGAVVGSLLVIMGPLGSIPVLLGRTPGRPVSSRAEGADPTR